MVTRVSRLPISVTSSAVIELTDGGRDDGMAIDAALDVPERSTTNWWGVGLRDVNAGAPLVFRMICGVADGPTSIAFSTMADAAAGAGCCAGFAGVRCFHHEAGATPALRMSMLAISRIRWTLLILPTFTISRPSTPSPSTLFPLSLRGKILDHFAETFDSSRVVDLLPEYAEVGRDAHYFA